MNKLYTINSLTWNITSDQISRVERDKYASPKTYTIYFVDRPDYQAVDISADVFEFFKESFPEHCISIAESSPGVPF
jgi:hypothetical protein